MEEKLIRHRLEDVLNDVGIEDGAFLVFYGNLHNGNNYCGCWGSEDEIVGMVAWNMEKWPELADMLHKAVAFHDYIQSNKE